MKILLMADPVNMIVTNMIMLPTRSLSWVAQYKDLFAKLEC
jgi:hypothetical protein